MEALHKFCIGNPAQGLFGWAGETDVDALTLGWSLLIGAWPDLWAYAGRVDRHAPGNPGRVFDADLQAIESPEQAEVASARLSEVEREFMVTADSAALLSLAREVIVLRAMLNAYKLRAETGSMPERQPPAPRRGTLFRD